MKVLSSLKPKEKLPAPNPLLIKLIQKKRNRKKNKKKPVKIDPARPTDDDIYHKQQLVEDLNESVKSGVQLSHVPFPDKDYFGENESGDASQTRKQQRDKDFSLSQSLDDDDDPFEKSPLNVNPSYQPQTAPSFLFSLLKFCFVIRVAPLIVRCAINTLILMVVTRTIDIYSSILFRFQWLLPLIENIVPAVIFSILQFSSKQINNLNEHITNFIDSKRLDNENMIQQVYDEIKSYVQILTQEFQTVEYSVEDYTPTLRLRENSNLLFVLVVRLLLWLCIPFFQFLQTRAQCFSS